MTIFGNGNGNSLLNEAFSFWISPLADRGNFQFDFALEKPYILVRKGSEQRSFQKPSDGETKMKNFDLIVGDFVTLEMAACALGSGVCFPYIVVTKESSDSFGIIEVPEDFREETEPGIPMGSTREILDFIFSHNIPEGEYDVLVRDISGLGWRFKTDPGLDEVWFKGYLYSPRGE